MMELVEDALMIYALGKFVFIDSNNMGSKKTQYIIN
jgi:hypothetical protein